MTEPSAAFLAAKRREKHTNLHEKKEVKSMLLLNYISYHRLTMNMFYSIIILGVW